MTEGEQSARGSRTRRIATGCGWLLAAAAIGLVSVIALVWFLVMRSFGPDCVDARTLSSSQYTGDGSVVLDAAHPVAEQRVSLSINAAALPVGVPTVATLVVRPPDGAPPPSLGAWGTMAQPVPAVIPEVTVLDDTTGEVLPAATSWQEATDTWRARYVSIPIDCAPGGDCRRSYRIRVSVPGLEGDASVPAAWLTQVKLAWEGVDTPCGQPREARLELEAATPVRLAAGGAAVSPIVVQEETVGPVIARHLTVSSDRAVDGASLRLALLRTDPVEGASQIPMWRQWVRVLPDEGLSTLADALVGDAQYGTGPTGYGRGPAGGGTLDVPVLAGCVPDAPCERGYWMVIQTVPTVPVWRGAPIDLGYGGAAGFRWAASVTGASPDGVTGSPNVRVRIDAPGGASPAGPSLTSDARSVTLTSNRVPTALDVTITVPERPAIRDGLDPLAGTMAVIHVSGHGYALVPEVRGPGAGPLRGYINGDGATNLLAHPLDSCPPAGACSVTLQLVGTFNVERTGGQADSAELEWQVELLEAPPGSTITFGELHELQVPTDVGLLPLAAASVVVVGIVVGIVIVVLRRRRIEGK